MLQELAQKIMGEPGDFRVSLVKQVPAKVALFGKRQTREELVAEQRRLKELNKH